MHRFISLRTLQGNLGLSWSCRESRYRRSCTLCNRFAVQPQREGTVAIPRVHSTWVSPERVSYIVSRRKKARPGSTTSSSQYNVVPKSKQRMRITVLDSSISEEVNCFLTSSSSSPAFLKNPSEGISFTIVLPPNSSDRLMRKSEVSASQSKSTAEDLSDSLALSQDAAKLIFKGLGRHRHLAEGFFPSRTKDQHKEKGKINQKLKKKPVKTEENEVPNFTKADFAGRRMGSLSLIQPSLKNQSQELTKMNQILKDGTDEDITDLDQLEETKQRQQQKLRNKVIASNHKRLIKRASIIDIFVHTGDAKHALQYATSGLKFFPSNPYRNILFEPLFCHAVKIGDKTTVFHILSTADKFQVNLSLQSYIMCFEFLGRCPGDEKSLEITRNLLHKMRTEKVELIELLQMCKGRTLVINRILEAVRAVEPETAAAIQHSSEYTVDILKPLNDPTQAKSRCYISPASGVLSHDSVAELVDEQILRDNKGIVKVKNIACQLSQQEIDELLKNQKEVEDSWRVSIASGFHSGLDRLKKDRSSHQLSVFLSCLPVEEYVNLIIEEVHNRIQESDAHSVGFTTAQRALGRRVKLLYDMQVFKKYGVYENAREALVKYAQWYAGPAKYPDGPSNPREIWERVVDEMGFDDSSFNFLIREWDLDILTKIGVFLYDVLLKDVKIDENIGIPDTECELVPAVYVVFRKTTKGYQRQLKMHPAIRRIFSNQIQPYLCIRSVDLPMMCPPRPWVTAKSGVYPHSSPSFQRFPDSKIGEKALAETIDGASSQQLYPCIDSLNQLGSVPWKINIPVLDVVTEVFNNGGSKELEIPSPPSAALEEPLLPSGVSAAQRRTISQERAEIRQLNAEMYSLWCDSLYKLCIAHEFRDRPFWLPHNMDFRGRVYPTCPNLQHMSNDMTRSLLCFAKGEKLGPDGLNWLKLHTINLVGNMSKDSLAARLDYCNKVMPQILDSAENPLTGGRWWVNSEYPWQTLAACKEIAAAVASGDPENYVSHYPVHQDGSCNGLQHYAALGHDSLGARSVNLIDTEKPADVYMCVANSVEQYRKRDADNGNPLAQSLERFICRKVVKQTVMTTVYGVTQYGAQLQIQGQLKDLDFPAKDAKKAAAYLTKLVFQSLGEMFTSSRNIQDWLTRCADGIVKSKEEPVRWVTPLGLPVVQPYFRRLVKCPKMSDKSDSGTNITAVAHRVPTSQKHRNAFSPNFIHSLDSCHMILTGLFCEQAGVTFVSVHDCYWVHPRNVPHMSKICREQFVALHSKPILEELSHFMIQTYCSPDSSAQDLAAAVEERRLRRLFAGVPPKGDFDLTEVLKSKYFFS